MPYRMNPRQFEQVLSLPAPQRYAHFIAKVADGEELWSLKGPEGFVLSGDDAGHECVPVWPHPDYATACAKGPWAESRAERIDLEGFLTRWIPGMAKDGRMVAVFPTPRGNGVVVDPQRLQQDLSAELEQYK